MSTSIRLKNSSALVGGKAKVPTPSDLAQGELAVNINKDDPSLFVKDSEGVVRKIAGSDATGVEGEYLSLAADAEAQTVATSETTTFTGQVDLPGGGGDTQALQKQEVEALIADPDGPADGNYLKLGAGTFDQTVASTGSTTFEGLLQTRNVQVRGNNDWESSHLQLRSTSTIGRIGFDDSNSIRINKDGAFTFNCASSAISGYGFTNMNIVSRHADSSGQTFASGFRLNPDVNANFDDYVGYDFRPDTNGFAGGTIGTAAGFRCASTVSQASVTNAIGFLGNLNAGGAASNNFNFFALGTAPNFYAGDTYIGGTTTRNTRELWESTLTEEQKEQLSAGTLTVPANVSTPGDGSFARQWWYDQQSAEDQLLIDSGELEYPSHLQADNFVDTFDLGDNTNINLLSNGSATFAGDVQIGEFDGNDYSKEGSKIFNSGQFRVVRQWDGNPSNDPRVFSAFLGPDNSNQTIDIRGSGSARFAGDVQSTSWDGRAGAAGYSINPAGAIVINGVADEYALRIYTENTNNVSPTIDLNSDGSATFAGSGTFNSYINRIYDGTNHDLTIGTDDYVLFYRTTGNVNDQKVVIKTDGSATFASTVNVGKNTDDFALIGATLRETGECKFTRENGVVATFRRNAVSGPCVEIRQEANINLILKSDGTAEFCQRNILFNNGGSATFTGDITAGNVVFNLETDNPDNYITTTEEYTETEYYTVEVPVVERPGVGTADIQDSVSTADLVDGDERETQTITKSREVTKTREVKTYTGPTMEIKEELLALRERTAQQDAIIAQMTEALKKLGADIDPPAETKTTRKKR